MSPRDSTRPDVATLTRRTLSGLRWAYAAAGANAVLQVAYVAAMSRLLEPAAFGLMALANIVVSFGFYFSRMGVAQALIQRPDIGERDVRAAATSGWLISGCCAGLLWLAAPLLGGLVDQPALDPVLRVMGLSFLLSGLSMTSQALLRREMRFAELSAVQVAVGVVGAAVGVILAVAGAGVWSLIWASLAASATQAVLQYRLVRHPMRPLLAVRELSALYRFGVKISLVRVGEFAGKNLDTLVVGHLTSVTLLGIYSRAFLLVDLPVTKYLTNALSTVLFPGFGRLQGDRARIARVHLSVIRLAAVVLFPVCAGIAVARREVVLVVLGDQWVQAVSLVPPFALAAALSITSKLDELLAESQDRLHGVMALQYGYLVVLAVLLALAGWSGGPIWVFAAALATGEALRRVAYIAFMRGVTDVPVRAVLQAHLPAVFAVLTVVAATAGTQRLLQHVLPPAALLAAEVVAGVAGLVAGIRLCPWGAVRADVRIRLVGAGGSGRLVAAGMARLLLGPAARPADSGALR